MASWSPATVAATVSAALHVVLLAMVAGASPLALTATLAVIKSARPRTDGMALAAGYVAGTLVACLVGLVAGSAFVDRIGTHGTIEAVVELLVGVVLLVNGARTLRSVPSPDRTGRGTALGRRLREMGPAAVFSMAALLGFGGPKRLLITLLAMTAVSGAGDRAITETTLVISYVVIATALVSAPVLFMIVAPNRAEPVLKSAELWLGAHAHGLDVWISLTFGAALVAAGLLRLVT